MEVAIEPEPPEPVRQAILAALAAPGDDGDAAWWRAGVEDSVADLRTQAGAQAGRPRSSRGAARA